MNKVFILATAMTLLVAAHALTGCGNAGGNQPGTALSVTNAGEETRVVVVMHTDLSDDEFAHLPIGFMERASTLGWRRVTGGVEMVAPAGEAVISNGTSSVAASMDGKFTLPDAKSVGSTPHYILVGNTKLPLIPLRTRAAKTNTTVYELHGTFSPNCCGNTAATRKAKTRAGEPMEGRCNDYNGWWSDHNNYPYKNAPWYDRVAALTNFVGSDCNQAMVRGLCWKEHVTSGLSCWKNHNPNNDPSQGGGCSRLIGHPWEEHWHN